MAEDPDERTELRRSFATRLRDLGLALELIAEDVMGDEDQSIDWVAAAPDGRAWLVLIEPGASSGALVERALVQRAWVAARIPDWRQLAPSLALRDGLAPGVVLVAESLERSTRIAAREAFGDACRLVRLARDARSPALETIEPPRAGRLRHPAPPPRLRSVFRTGLGDADLA